MTTTNLPAPTNFEGRMTITGKLAKARVAMLNRFSPEEVWLSDNGWGIITPEATVQMGTPGECIVVPWDALKRFVTGDGEFGVGDNRTLTQGTRSLPVVVSSTGTWATMDTRDGATLLDAKELKQALGVAAFAGRPTMRHRPPAWLQVVRFTGVGGEAWATDDHRMAWARCDAFAGIYAAPAVAALATSLPSTGTIIHTVDTFAWDDVTVYLTPRDHKPLDRAGRLESPDEWTFCAEGLATAIAGMPGITTITPKAGLVLTLESEGARATIRAVIDDAQDDVAPFGVNATYLQTALKWCPASDVMTVGRRTMWWANGSRGVAVALVKLGRTT